MIVQQNDEETPLLQRPRHLFRGIKFGFYSSWRCQKFLLLGPLPRLFLKDIGVTHGDETQVGHYAGILQSSYYAAHTLTIFYWSQLSDHIGRKPVILIALLAISISMFSFGLSKTFFALVVRTP
ncbi:uncharacterized protein HD556DRAFT_628198 [Suillus plorans]|uniref:Major facilitator superfamily (MFS) profile domain-containing protein n=1 Tax=Suillus plorans TaxID=116603 RepID=A0A9P7DGN5_9AGAM|nr:uncharacterized protein HD556DRAFT_628198 [Suillus plorans]KAG1791889.1 hypothetical protein HD556DRAFT_628198 [Suillus plorans]